ncbi:hypothetical protein GCM10027456_17410 [Kineosporia babensis]
MSEVVQPDRLCAHRPNRLLQGSKSHQQGGSHRTGRLHHLNGPDPVNGKGGVDRRRGVSGDHSVCGEHGLNREHGLNGLRPRYRTRPRYRVYRPSPSQGANWLASLTHYVAASVSTRIHLSRREIRRSHERGDVPGWVLVTLMTAGLVVALWGAAGPRLVQIFNDSVDNVVGGP